jgi:hypothetical protein
VVAAAGLIAVVVQRDEKALAVEQVKRARKFYTSLPFEQELEKKLRALVSPRPARCHRRWQ